ncbi:Leo1-like protein-domain-containing protein [Phlyctochytrium arcticum]|nr:Leo1-like protein-domain-containing protein [Phlyctochytrium arcticum]
MYSEEGGSDRAQIPPRRPPKPESKLDMSVPKIPRFIHEGQEVYLVRPPNFMGLEHKPFDPKTFSEEEEALRREQEGATHVSVENTIRWRSVVDEHGQERKESNARLVRWSDNTVSLMLGNEFFDANTTEGSQHQYLTVQFPQEGIFQTQARMPKTMMFRPYGVNQLVHRKLTREIAIKHEKKIKTKQIVTMMDPEKQREALERAEMEKMRARRRLESKRRNTALSRGLTARGLEDDSEDEAMYLRGNEGIRRAFDGYDDDFVVNDEEDDEDEEERREAERRDRIMRAKQAPETPRNANPSQGSSSSSHLPPKADPASRADRRPPRPSKRVGDDAMDVDRDDVGVSRSKKKRHIISSDEDD